MIVIPFPPSFIRHDFEADELMVTLGGLVLVPGTTYDPFDYVLLDEDGDEESNSPPCAVKLETTIEDFDPKQTLVVIGFATALGVLSIQRWVYSGTVEVERGTLHARLRHAWKEVPVMRQEVLIDEQSLTWRTE